MKLQKNGFWLKKFREIDFMSFLVSHFEERVKTHRNWPNNEKSNFLRHVAPLGFEPARGGLLAMKRYCALAIAATQALIFEYLEFLV